MTVVTLSALETILGASEPIASGTVRIEYWAGNGPYTDVDGAEVTFPQPIVVRISAGAPAEVIDLVPTGSDCCVRWVIRSQNGGYPLTRFTSIPASGPVEFGDLPVVNPASFAPEPLTPALFESMLMLMFGATSVEHVTKDEYDAIPTPRPADVLYVVAP